MSDDEQMKNEISKLIDTFCAISFVKVVLQKANRVGSNHQISVLFGGKSYIQYFEHTPFTDEEDLLRKINAWLVRVVNEDLEFSIEFSWP